MGTINSFNFSRTLEENSSQFASADSNGTALVAVIGFDFGTSSSKILVQLPYYQGAPTFAVPFGNFASSSLKYLLPTQVSIEPNSGICSLNQDSNDDIKVATIKVGLMDDPDAFINSIDGIEVKIPVQYIATAYLALALRYTRCWFIDNNDQYSNNYLKWSFNLGLPAAKDDEKEPRNSFEMVGKAAWLASLKPGPITIDSAKESFDEVKFNKSSDFIVNFKVIPEVVAEIHGYNNSDFQRDGLHVLIDAGAKTLDINSFLINGGENKYTILLADVANFGAMVLHENRIEAIEKVFTDGRVESHLKSLKVDDTTQIVPRYVEEYIPNDLDKSSALNILKSLRAEDDDFREKKAFYNFIAKMINLLRTDRNPFCIKLDEKLEHLPVILCGGASKMPLYQDLVNKEINEWLQRHVADGFQVREIKLPKPENLEADITDDDIHRLAVAYGLSFPEYEIGEYHRPSEVDIQRQTSYRDVGDDYVGSSQV